MAAHCDFLAGVTAGKRQFEIECNYISRYGMNVFLFRRMQHVHIASSGYSENEYAVWKYAICSSGQNSIQD